MSATRWARPDVVVRGNEESRWFWQLSWQQRRLPLGEDETEANFEDNHLGNAWRVNWNSICTGYIQGSFEDHFPCTKVRCFNFLEGIYLYFKRGIGFLFVGLLFNVMWCAPRFFFAVPACLANKFSDQHVWMILFKKSTSLYGTPGKQVAGYIHQLYPCCRKSGTLICTHYFLCNLWRLGCSKQRLDDAAWLES